MARVFPTSLRAGCRTDARAQRAGGLSVSRGSPSAGSRRGQFCLVGTWSGNMDRTARLMRDGYVEYLRSKSFDPYFGKLHRAPRWRYVLAVPMILSLAGAGIGVGLIA